MRVLAVVLVLGSVAACDPDATSQPPGPPPTVEAPDGGVGAGTPTVAASPPDAVSGATIDVEGCEPRSLVPTDMDSCGTAVVGALFASLVEYDLISGAPVWGDDAPRALAADIRSDDALQWEIELKDGWTFHDGTPITADDLARSWSYGAFAPNAQTHASLFSVIDGYEAMQCPRADPCTEDEERQLTGVDVIDDQTLQVTLQQPFSQFPARLGHPAFTALPPVAFEDPEAFGESPLGSGPFAMAGAWDHGTAVTLERYEDYAGEPAEVAGVVIHLLGDPDDPQGLDLLADGQLDIAAVPPGPRPEGVATVQRPGPGYAFLVVPQHVGALADPRLAEALSLAIDRRGVTEATLGGSATPAKGLVSPVVGGAQPGACGRRCEFDPERAQALYEQAGGMPDGQLSLWFNLGAEEQTALNAIAEQWRRHLPGLEVEVRRPSFTDLLTQAEDRLVDGLYRLRYAHDEPTPRDYLAPLHGAGGLFNLDGFSDPQVDALIAQGDGAGSVEAAWPFYARAERRLVSRWHHIPLWFDLVRVAHSDEVAQVTLDPFGRIRFADVVPLTE